MKINNAEKATGLTQKAIRLYESKGLIKVSRDSNGYRNYSEDDIEALKKIKLFRSVGVSVTDIKLYLFGVISLCELMDKRKGEILTESGKNSEKYKLCESISKSTYLEDIKSKDTLDDFTDFSENEETNSESHGKLCVGIDIGTTTVSASVFDIENKKQLEAFSLPHNSYLRSDGFSEQSVSIILDKAEKLLYHILSCYQEVVSIGLSGQMHGLVYIDSDGKPLSDLINWQDKRADIPLSDGKTACEIIKEITGENISTGYALATHYYNLKNDLVPKNAVSFCSIADLFSMKICGLKNVAVHMSFAASFGLFDVKNGTFMAEKLSLLGIDKSFLPLVSSQSVIVGHHKDIPVSIALGDNQASFLGSVSEHTESILVNIGTGSQVSSVSNYRETQGDVELRPFIEGKYLVCGCALCGGFAYSMLENFFRSYTSSAGFEEASQYKTINKLALEAYENGDGGLDVDVSFFGKRSDPSCRGSVKNIDRNNFTPRALALGILKGMCNELYDLYESFSEKKTLIVASGGCVKKNNVLKDLISDRFSLPVYLNAIEEEAATGAALFSAFASGKIKYTDGFSEYISYL
ncbi:MAG: MerR family transcriptional regulator [Ruminococcaceae bacterium]|nr:MerR family transcriptional regulator [Oscillospiraceae bacterium]